MIRKEMGCSRAEFLKQFGIFAQRYSMTYQVSQNQIIAQESQAEIKIEIIEQEQRQIGALMLPTLAVTFQFISHSKQQQEQFMRRFDRSFQRGGG